MRPSGIELKRRYSIRQAVAQAEDSANDNQAHWGEQLWRLIDSEVTVEMPAVLVDREDYGFVQVRLVNHLLSRLVVRARQVRQTSVEISEESRLAVLTDVVLDVVALSSDSAARAAWLLDRICGRIKRRGADLTKVQIRTIRDMADRHAHRCYVCGISFLFDGGPKADNDDEHAKLRFFEIDHIFPQARGGSRSTENLASICNSCNKLKDVHLSFADFAIEAVTTSSLDASNVSNAYGRKIRFIVLWRQRGRCDMCDQGFFEASDERLYLLRRNDRDAYHFMNVAIVCGDCIDNNNIEVGVKLRD